MLENGVDDVLIPFDQLAVLVEYQSLGRVCIGGVGCCANLLALLFNSHFRPKLFPRRADHLPDGFFFPLPIPPLAIKTGRCPRRL